MTLAELIREVRDLLGDEGELYTDAVIIRQLNNAQRELAELARGLTAVEINVSNGQSNVPRPSGVSYLKEAHWQRGTYRWRLCIRYGYPPEHASVTGDPEEVYVVGNTLWLYPTPSQDGTLILVGIPHVTEMKEVTDVPSLSGAERVMVAYAVWRLLASTEGSGSANVRAAAEDYLRLRSEWAVAEAQRHPPTEVIRRLEEWW